MKSLTLLGAASMLSVLSAMVSTSARASSLDPAQGSAQPGNAASTVVPQPAPGCSVSGASDGEVQARIAEGILEVVSKQAGGDPVCAAVKLPALGRDAVVRAGVAYVSLVSGGLVIVNLADPTHPTVDRTVDSYRAVASLRVVEEILWTVDSTGVVVKYELQTIQPPTPISSETQSVNARSTDQRSAGRVVVLHDSKPEPSRVRSGNTGRWTAGFVLLCIGPPLTLVGMLGVAGTSVVFGDLNPSSPDYAKSANRATSGWTGFGFALGLGVAGTIAGPVLLTQ